MRSSPWYVNLFENPLTAQFAHRALAYAIAILAAAFAVYVWRRAGASAAAADTRDNRCGSHSNRAWDCDHRLRRPCCDRIGPSSECDPCLCPCALGSPQGGFARRLQLTREFGVRRQATNGGLTKFRSFFPYKNGSPSPVRRHPPAALRRAWPAAVSHSEVCPKRG